MDAYMPAAKFLASPEAPGVEQAEQAERISYLCAEFTYGLGKEINAEFNTKFLTAKWISWEMNALAKLCVMAIFLKQGRTFRA